MQWLRTYNTHHSREAALEMSRDLRLFNHSSFVVVVSTIAWEWRATASLARAMEFDMLAMPPRHWAVGDRVEALDEMGTWYEAAVVGARGADESRELRVHYKGWNSRRDEWIGASSSRVRPTGGVLDVAAGGGGGGVGGGQQGGGARLARRLLRGGSLVYLTYCCIKPCKETDTYLLLNDIVEI